jgi:N-acetylmuramoyl-L-alanine amidase
VTIPASERLNSSVELAVDRLHWTIWADHPGELVPALDTVVGTVQQILDRNDRAGRVVLEVRLTEKPLGWKSEWRNGHLVLRIRSQRQLRSGLPGLIVAVDAGHPPGGTIGPTGYTEAAMTLDVARAVSRRLDTLGAHPVLLREDGAPVSLDERIARAERAGAHVLISIHGNSPGPGRPPWAVYGTQTIWLQPMSQQLANALLREVRTALDQPPLGAHRQDFALLRPTWFPAVLVEGTGLVLPEREAYLRTPDGIAAYADGIVSGLQFWLRLAAPPADD